MERNLSKFTILSRLPTNKYFGLLLFLLTIITCVSCAQVQKPNYTKYAPPAVLNNSYTSSNVVATYYGTSSILIRDDSTAFLVDGFFSRPSKTKLLFTKLEQKDIGKITRILDKALIPKKAGGAKDILKGVIVVHSHYDHVMDAPCIANEYKTKLVGSSSTLNVYCREESVPAERRVHVPDFKMKCEDNRAECVPDETHRSVGMLGNFDITMIYSKHGDYGSKFIDHLMGIGKPIKKALKFPAHFLKMCEGQSYSVLAEHKPSSLRILVQGSAGFEKGAIEAATEGKPVDWLFLAIGGLAKNGGEDFAYQYFEETIKTTGARYIVPIHWDDFTQPAEKPLTPASGLLGNFSAEMQLLEDFVNEIDMLRRPKIVLLDFDQHVEMGRAHSNLETVYRD